MSNIRNRIFNPIKEDFDFPIVAMKFYSKKIPTIDPKAMMFPGQSFLEGSVEYLSFLIAGWEWILFLNQDRLLIDPNFIYMSLSKEGTLYVPSGDITDHRFFKLFGSNFVAPRSQIKKLSF
jgi:hypothetical protein